MKRSDMGKGRDNDKPNYDDWQYQSDRLRQSRCA